MLASDGPFTRAANPEGGRAMQGAIVHAGSQLVLASILFGQRQSAMLCASQQRQVQTGYAGALLTRPWTRV